MDPWAEQEVYLTDFLNSKIPTIQAIMKDNPPIGIRRANVFIFVTE